jgi:hypothetical protein
LVDVVWKGAHADRDRDVPDVEQSIYEADVYVKGCFFAGDAPAAANRADTAEK